MNNEKRFKICGVLRKIDCLDLLKNNMSYEELKSILQPNYNQLLRLMKSYNKKELQFLLYNTQKIGLDKITTIIRKNAVNGEDEEIEEQADALEMIEAEAEVEAVVEAKIEAVVEAVEEAKKVHTKDNSSIKLVEPPIKRVVIQEPIKEEPIDKITIGEELNIENITEHKPSDKNIIPYKDLLDYKELNDLGYKNIMKYFAEKKVSEKYMTEYFAYKREAIRKYLIKNGALKQTEMKKVNELSIKELYGLYNEMKGMNF